MKIGLETGLDFEKILDHGIFVRGFIFSAVREYDVQF